MRYGGGRGRYFSPRELDRMRIHLPLSPFDYERGSWCVQSHSRPGRDELT